MDGVFNYDLANVTDRLRLVGELEHLRFHALMAVMNAPEEEVLGLLVLAKHCQDTRRDIMKKYFKVENRHWCMVKSAARLLQITEELADGDLDEIKNLKHIIDDTIEITTGEDISDCESCKKDFNG